MTVGPYDGNYIVRFRDMVFSGNTEPLDGGALAIYPGSIVEILGSAFLNNSAERGGAIFSTEASVIVVNSTFSRNSAHSAGGAIHAQGFQHHLATSTSPSEGVVPAAVGLAVDGCLFQENRVKTGKADAFGLINELGAPLEFSQFVSLVHPAPSGGAILGSGLDTLDVKNSTFENNVAPAGGAIFTGENKAANFLKNIFVNNTLVKLDAGTSSQNVTVNNAEFLDERINERMSHGGAVYGGFSWERATLVFEQCQFLRNRGNYGGAIHVVGPTFTSMSVVGCTFEQNEGEVSGGGLLIRNIGDLRVSNVTFSYNRAQSGGGLVLTNGVSGVIGTNSTFVGNRAEEGGGLMFYGTGL